MSMTHTHSLHTHTHRYTHTHCTDTHMYTHTHCTDTHTCTHTHCTDTHMYTHTHRTDTRTCTCTLTAQTHTNVHTYLMYIAKHSTVELTTKLVPNPVTNSSNGDPVGRRFSMLMFPVLSLSSALIVTPMSPGLSPSSRVTDRGLTVRKGQWSC